LSSSNFHEPSVAHEVAAGDVTVDAARWADAVRGAREVAAADHEAPRHDPGADDLAGVVDVVDEAVQRADALREAALDVRPLGRRQDPQDEVQRERALERRAALAGRVERDALLQEDRVSRRLPAATSCSGPSAFSAAASATACGCGLPSARAALAAGLAELSAAAQASIAARRKALHPHGRAVRRQRRERALQRGPRGVEAFVGDSLEDATNRGSVDQVRVHHADRPAAPRSALPCKPRNLGAATLS
jgi:hypothetical protein